jgi:ABC-type glycerol-3-phosphate transport system substrate-binding protein
MKMRVLFTAAVSLLALAACGNPAPAAPTAEEIAKASADINAWFDAEYEEELQMSPIALTFQGRKDQYDKLPTIFSEAAIDRDLNGAARRSPR